MVVGFPAQQVARLAVEDLAERGRGRGADGLGATVLGHGEVAATFLTSPIRSRS
jgi:hypothetical protein